MTEHAGPGPAPVVPHARRPVLRVVGGTAVGVARTEPIAAEPDPADDARARAAAARAAHPSSGLGVPGFQRPQPATVPGQDDRPVTEAPAAPPAEQSAEQQAGQRPDVPALDGLGPHLVTGPVLLPAARSGDALKVEVLHLVDPDASDGPLETGCTAYLPVRADGAAFCPRELHKALGAAGQPLRGTFRVTVCRTGAQDVPAVAHRQPFAETAEHWIVVGRSGTDDVDERTFCLTAAMQQAVRAGVDFLARDRGMDRPIAHAYLSSAAEFAVTRLEDSSAGAHGRIRKSDFR
jgi:acetamidase/formamidase